ncbi:C-terminal binding protein [Anaeromicropila herbilytica]|uniref:Glycerate dehydrogenase n=1 Tax=Anaeromicropila herbilytica TaxID=2785025 RepID=A0A7R7IDR7_9FIRM|nr:C-terminal binding protein [Anaeromicropila herbilytica]BCN31369.1 glycerate dehydrogenase [Anaeromicropila herbilytica]
MNILISDYEDVLDRDLEYEKQLLLEHLPEAHIEVYSYINEEEFLEKIKDVDVLSTAFLPLNKKVLQSAKRLKCISVNATGYGNIDIQEARNLKIEVRTVKEYCTTEVAEHTMALLLSLVRNIKHYSNEIDRENIWKYQSVVNMKRLAGQTLAIFGFGRIGQAVTKKARAFDLKIIAVDPFTSKEIADELGVTLVDKEYALEHADIITNHMNQTLENKQYFSKEEFLKMKKQPLFINVGRGECVNEQDLLWALEKKHISGAALDVLKEENPELIDHPLTRRDNVILTPHAAFYSEQSMIDLQTRTCENIIDSVKGWR